MIKLRKLFLDNLSSLKVSVVTKTTDYQITEQDNIINVNAASGNVVIDLPVLNTLLRNHKYYIKKIDSSSNTVTIQGVRT